MSSYVSMYLDIARNYGSVALVQKGQTWPTDVEFVMVQDGCSVSLYRVDGAFMWASC